MSLASAWKKRRHTAGSGLFDSPVQDAPWRILVVDDDPDIRALTRLNLRGFRFDGRPLDIIEADSASQAREILARQEPFAVALVDVVMESDDAGVRLVDHIRKTRRDRMIRVVIRTGQPGMAPERYVIDNYDIDDYKDKTELTAQKLYTTVRSALKAFRDLQEIETQRQTLQRNREGLKRILQAAPQENPDTPDALTPLCQGTLFQASVLFNSGHEGRQSPIRGMLVTVNGEEPETQSVIGAFDPPAPSMLAQLKQACIEKMAGINERTRGGVDETIDATAEACMASGLAAGSLLAPLAHEGMLLGYIYLENAHSQDEDNSELLRVLANQGAAALATLRLHNHLREGYAQAVNMLALAAEFKDEDTGDHVQRVAGLTERLGLALGLDANEAQRLGEASRLHDIGKIGVADRILRKPARLDTEEFESIKSHCRIGAAILENAANFSLAHEIALYHHERWDGGGYPHGLQGEAIPFSSRIVAVADVFDALTHVRPYKEAWPLEKAVAVIGREAGGHFDPRIVAAFLRLNEQNALPA